MDGTFACTSTKFSRPAQKDIDDPNHYALGRENDIQGGCCAVSHVDCLSAECSRVAEDPELPDGLPVPMVEDGTNPGNGTCNRQHEKDVGSSRRRRNDTFLDDDGRKLRLPSVPRCTYCGAYKFYKETDRICCSRGEIILAKTVLPQYLINLITGTDETCKNFQNMIRTYNNHFAYSSIGIHCDEQYQRRDHSIYTVKVQGQIYHFLNDLMPGDNSGRMSGMQFYFYDPDHEVTNRLLQLPRLDAIVVRYLVDLLKSNPYSQFLKKATLLEDPEQYHIVIRSDPGLDQRTYNRPTCSEVAGIWTGDESGDVGAYEACDIRVYTTSGHSQRVKYFYGCYDPLQYVLMFPNGEPGWHANIARNECSAANTLDSLAHISGCQTFEEFIQKEQEGFTLAGGNNVLGELETPAHLKSNRKRTTVSCREYYVYKLQDREGDRSYILRFGRLLQQYVIDIYIKLESMRLEFLRYNQKKMRQEHYQGVIDSVISGIRLGERVGTTIYLFATFIGGPRDMKQRYLDSMCLVQEFGRPDLFLTMTCNPNWREIKERLQPGEEAQNRPDLCARVFKAKLGILHDKIMNGEISGQVESVVHVVEFQKRGLPHAHILVILKPQYKYLTPEAYDRIVCAELPDKEKDPYLYKIVVKHMMHGPCGDLNPDNVCMRDGRCKNHYPKEFVDNTVHGKGSYPIYRRRNDGRRAKVRGKVLDNRWVIPYNSALLAYFDCHINVEICCDIRAVKYLYKYVHKGHDKVMFRVAPNSANSVVDEISDFQNARWVSPVEAVWRLFAFTLSGMYPSVLQLQLHLPNFHCIHFQEEADLKEILQDDKLKRTMLTEFFNTNANDPEAKRLNLLYKEFPKFYVWNSAMRSWKKRKRGAAVARLCTVSPLENERYYLRILLNNVRCPVSFDDLLMVDGILNDTYQQAAYKRGLLQDDDDAEKTMEEASVYQMPSELRRLFATLLHYCKPEDPRSLFDQFYDHMAEDFRKHKVQMKLSDGDILQKVLQGINDTLESIGQNVNDFHLTSVQYISTDDDRHTREVAAERNIEVPPEDLHAVHKLNVQQRNAFDIIFEKAISSTGGAFFIDGPGGTGKSFLYKVLLAHIRSKGYIAIVVASSGIASSNFLGGRTAHSRFKIPIDAGANTKCGISVQSGEADLLRNSKIIIWDEAPMADKLSTEAVSRLLKDLCKNKSPFGGKLVVFGGDFRQVLPVVRGGGRREQVDASLVRSDLSKYFTRLQLTDNMRAKDDPGFINYLMRVGNGEEPLNARGEIEIPQPMLVQYTTMEKSLEDLISYAYPDMSAFEQRPFEMMGRSILSPKNEFVDDINSILVGRLPGEEVIYISDDRAKNSRDQGEYIDYLNSLEPRGLPQHKLILKVNSPVMLLRNINPVEGLCNGTRLICERLTSNVIGARIATGQFQGKYVWIPRIPLEPNAADNKYLIPFVRRQFPLKLCFAMTINKSQGQTLDFVGLYLKQPVFTHGQLYVALSRAKTGENIKVLILPPTYNDPATKYTANVIYNEVLVKANAM